ncbi:DNA-3-methyladenine glycosylase family protein [Alkalicoccus daliensis]|uniref:DNA-3-methyladenine glycosylase II n=1 Tax=Alkalicoccus daliensis TaxID=745820 RepID=A0A1H0DV91_9BACI|nr:hypothetical protein [Alkalicoccus daliensis]SDN73901.1 HhH-GPD superfamily base excision DNA repair protein [Alkalicoccus daliensis]
MKFAYTLTSRFVQTFGFQKEGAWFYPSPAQTADLHVDNLRALQFSGRKAEYIIDTSKIIAEGTLDLASLYKLTNEEIISDLIQIRGVGRWTAENFLMFGMGRLDLLPIQDIGILNAVKKLKSAQAKPAPEILAGMGEQWKPYRTYASLYLWESLQLKNEKR